MLHEYFGLKNMRTLRSEDMEFWIKPDHYYSWIGHGLQSELTLAFSLWLSEFKTKTSFGFIIKKSGVVF